jgi:hypothetical protein
MRTSPLRLGRQVPLVALLAIAAACGGSRRTTSAARRSDRNLITHEQLLEHRFNNAYEAVAALHGTWLQTRGTDSFSNPTQVWVYYDDTKLGGVDTLREVSVNAVAYIRYYDGVTATARWGLDHGQGVIFVSSRPPSS